MKVMIIRNENRRPSGDARVWVSNEREAEIAIKKNGEKLDGRPVVVQ